MIRIQRLVVGAIAALSVASAPRAQTPGEQVASAAAVNPTIFSVGDEPYPDHHVAFEGGVVGIPDLTYSILKGYRPLKLDLYLPPDSYAAKGPRPLLIYIHGGGWVGGGPRLSGAFKNWPDVLASIARQGFVVAAVSYRFSGEAAAPAAIQDVKSAIRWLRVNAAKYDIDKGRAMAWGQSAGGQLAALAAVSCGAGELEPGHRTTSASRLVEIQPSSPEGADAESDCVQGAVAWYGVFDFASLPPSPTTSAFLGCGSNPCSAEALRSASALSYVGDKTPPILLIHGTDDTTVPIAQSRTFFEALQARHITSELLIIPAVQHSFIGKAPEATRDASKQALRRTIDFIEATIGDSTQR